MNTIVDIFRKKPLFTLIFCLSYIFVVGFVKWNIRPNISSILFLAGGAVGVYFLDAAEVLFHLTPSPFRSIVFSCGFIIVSLFIITSSASFLASGFVLSSYVTILLWKISEWQKEGNLNSWYRMISVPVPVVIQRYLLYGHIAVFLLETTLFIL